MDLKIWIDDGHSGIIANGATAHQMQPKALLALDDFLGADRFEHLTHNLQSLSASDLIVPGKFFIDSNLAIAIQGNGTNGIIS